LFEALTVIFKPPAGATPEGNIRLPGDQPVGYQCNIYSFLAFAGKVKKHTFSFFPGCCKSIIVSGREIFSVTVAYGITEFIIFAFRNINFVGCRNCLLQV